jgi:hypothetical protein
MEEKNGVLKYETYTETEIDKQLKVERYIWNTMDLIEKLQ